MRIKLKVLFHPGFACNSKEEMVVDNQRKTGVEYLSQKQIANFPPRTNLLKSLEYQHYDGRDLDGVGDPEGEERRGLAAEHSIFNAQGSGRRKPTRSVELCT